MKNKNTLKGIKKRIIINLFTFFSIFLFWFLANISEVKASTTFNQVNYDQLIWVFWLTSSSTQSDYIKINTASWYILWNWNHQLDLWNIDLSASTFTWTSTWNSPFSDAPWINYETTWFTDSEVLAHEDVFYEYIDELERWIVVLDFMKSHMREDDLPNWIWYNPECVADSLLIHSSGWVLCSFSSFNTQYNSLVYEILNMKNQINTALIQIILRDIWGSWTGICIPWCWYFTDECLPCEEWTWNNWEYLFCEPVSDWYWIQYINWVNDPMNCSRVWQSICDVWFYWNSWNEECVTCEGPTIWNLDPSHFTWSYVFSLVWWTNAICPAQWVKNPNWKNYSFEVRDDYKVYYEPFSQNPQDSNMFWSDYDKVPCSFWYKVWTWARLSNYETLKTNWSFDYDLNATIGDWHCWMWERAYQSWINKESLLLWGKAFHSSLWYISLMWEENSVEYWVELDSSNNLIWNWYNPNIWYISFSWSWYWVIFNETTNKLEWYAYNDEMWYISFSWAWYWVDYLSDKYILKWKAFSAKVWYLFFSEDETIDDEQKCKYWTIIGCYVAD